jgi:uncharacterized protein DUF6473
MAYEYQSDHALSYFPCRYGKSKLLFRGPKKKLDGDYVAVLGGTETYGKFVENPFTEMLEQRLGTTVANLGCVNAGPDVFIGDEVVTDICSHARVTVIQIAGAQNLSNRFYAVHPRRNDRFLKASKLLETIYRDLDFTDYNFTRHLLSALESNSADKFLMVRQELKEAWVARMTTLLAKIGSKVVLLWMADHAPEDNFAQTGLQADPLFVDRDMLERVRPMVDDIVEVVADHAEVDAGHERMVFSELDAPSARQMLGAVAHDRVAGELQGVLRGLL